MRMKSANSLLREVVGGTTADAYAELETRWKAAFTANGLCAAGGKLTERQTKNIIGELQRSYEPFGTRKDDDPSRVSEFQSDLARAEQVMKENGCSPGEGTGIAYGQGATTTLQKHDIEKATTSLEAAAWVDKWARETLGWKSPDGDFLRSLGDLLGEDPQRPKDGPDLTLWTRIPMGVKIAGGVTLGVIGLRALARVLGR